MSIPASPSRGLVLTVSALVMLAGADLLSRSSHSAALAVIASTVELSVSQAVPWAAFVLRTASIAVRAVLEPRRGCTVDSGGPFTGLAVGCLAAAVFLGSVAWLRTARRRAPGPMVGPVRRGAPRPSDRMGDLAVTVRCASAAGPGRDRGVLCEVVETPFGVRMVMGDVRGSGRPAAARLIARVLGEIREAAQYEPSLAGVAARAEACVSGAVAAGVLMTAVFAEFSGAADVVLLSCGHAPVPLVASEDGVRTVACRAGPPVGLAELALGEPHVRREPFTAGQTLVVCSDGVAEARGRGGARYPLEERLARLAGTAGWRAGGAEERAELLCSDLTAFAGEQWEGDAVVLLVERVRSADG
ncbi:PP2C family protein-serine/threonine phosphatase [Kitasatospora sp. NPDC058162]|uniref:PP2C family protein-serine/threonine phosphatase n=1 Tax=Kitasatospora sp. NPDC058162 TaxID=3346362 RepID=UPI0036DCD912